MHITKTNLNNCLIIQPDIFKDERGYFFESFNQQRFEEATGISPHFVQDNESQSQYGTIRGLHMQTGKWSQAKLIRVIKGKVKDVVIDMRKDSPTFKQKFEIELSEDNKTQLYVPKGFLHGFSVLSETAIFSYKCDNYYHKVAETGVNPLDKTLNINWGVSAEEAIISGKDKEARGFENILKRW
ncbi:dTDP-4-dehydrorhamnose 3,5-epimerase [Flavobacterium sp. CS20]|uniref:dTDP-4-dehydrorhamnose 3,5-epimerase n=1 Tax=Flavobacterium sp. CS20 TaxID=2775246 RepID=UPI001B39F6C6|nr:dTDP-4-dehydrorhamnose 3,5-epimerase [Flavobacterium sp. CS20]QTY26676.1 dTDP-4-dehydrorhamnose 3,5-epimerase [Flavobacterium sp. CS20]